MMSYRGFGYSGGYRYSAPEDQQANPYPLGRNNIADPPSAPNPILQNDNADRNYQQVPGWQGQNLPNPQSSSMSGNNNWLSNSSNLQRQHQSPYPQPLVRNQGLNRNVGQQQFQPPQFEPQPSGTTVPNTAAYNNRGFNNPAPQSAASTFSGGLYYQSNPPSQTPTTSASSIGLEYQPSNMEPFHRPASSQRERDAAASAMTALSTSIPSRSLPHGQQQQYSTSTHTDVSSPLNNTAQTAYHRNPTTHNYSMAQSNVSAAQVASQNINQYSTRSPSFQSRSNAAAYSGRSSHSPSMTTAPQRTSLQLQSQSPNMPASAPRMPVSADPPQQPSRLQPSPRPPSAASVSQQQNQNPVPAQATSGQTDNTPAPITVNDNSSSRYSEANNMQSYQSTNPLPNFVDPTQIYDPYHLKMQAAMERKRQEEEEEARRRQNAEAEAEAARLQEEEERRRLEERLRAEEEVRKHLEGMEQPSNNTHSAPSQSVGYQGVRGSRTDGDMEGRAPEAGAPDSTSAPVQPQETTPSQKPQKNTQKKPRQKREKTAQQSADQAAPKKRSRKRKSANDAIPASQPLASTEGNATDEKQGEPESDMASEVQGMIQKMNKLKSQNPSLFAKLCDDLQLLTHSESGLFKQNDPKSLGGTENSNTTAASQPESDNAISQQAPQPEDQLPDLGKFPAARRKPKDTGKRSSVPAMPDSPAQEKETRGTDVSTAEEGPDLGKFPAARRRTRSDKGQHRPHNREAGQGEAETKQDATGQEQSNQPGQATEQQGGSKSSSKPYNIWPSAKRHALAEAACNYISGVSKNKEAGRTCEPSVILDLIDQNPTYIEICEQIETRGYTLNRVHFAKHLLKKVPDLKNSGAAGGSSDNQAKAPATTTTSTTTITTTRTAAAAAPSAPSQSQAQMAPPPVPSAASLTTPAHPGMPPPASAANTSAAPPAVFHSPPAPHALHRISSDDGPSAARHVPSTNGKPFRFLPVTVGQPVSQTGRGLAPQGFGTFPQSQLAPGPMHKPGYKLDPRLRVPAPPAHTPSPGSKEALARKRNFSELVDLTQSLSDEEDTGPSSSKSPRVETSAEHADIQQPPPVPQTAQPAVQQVPQSTDLSRFKADTSPTGKQEALRRRHDLVKPINKSRAIRKSYYDPRTIARDVLIASGRHPTDRPLNSHLTKLREKFTFVDNNSDLETFRWEVVDPGGPPRPEVAPEPLITKPPELPKLHNQTAARDSDASDDPTPTSQPSQKSKPKPSSLRISHTVDDRFSSPEPMRPTEHKTADESPSRQTPRRRGRPPGSKNKSTLDALAQAQRPQVVVPAGTLSKHRVYKCQWAQCDAKLHSLAVLQKHVLRVHLPNSTVCQWLGCSTGGRSGEAQVSSSTFTTEELRQHLESHLSELAWQKGDGPSPMRSDRLNRDLHNCLADSSGRTVVPQASTRGAPPTLILPAAYASIRSFNKMRGNESDRAKAQEVVRALEAKQAMVGVGVNRGGCTLMNPARQNTIEAFEKVFEVVPEDS